MAPATLLSPHFSQAHPNHPLTHHSDGRDYTCHACNTSGFGARFQCHACPVDIHVYCANCPDEFISSFLHSHPLTLAPSTERRICDVCRGPIGGMLYRCQDCGFDVHPLCTQLPEEVRHVIDHTHKLKLKKVPSGNCAVCGFDCSSLWVYGCDVCVVNTNIHPQCLLKPYRSDTLPVPPAGSRGIKHAPPPHFPGGFFGPYGYGNYDPNSMNLNGFGFGYGGGGYSPHAHVSPWGFPYYYHFAPPPSPIYYGHVPSTHQPHHGGHGHTPLSIGGLMFGSSMFSLVENLAAGAITEFLFGSD